MKAIEHDGATAAVRKPLRLRRHESGGLPDPAACVDALAVANARGSAEPPRVCVADGSTWRELAYLSDLAALRQAAAPVDLTPLVRPMVEETVRAMAPQLALPAPAVSAAVPALPAPDSPQVRELANHMLQMAETIEELGRRLAAAEERVAFLEERAVARVEVKGGA